jgi:hypothetical protein
LCGECVGSGKGAGQARLDYCFTNPPHRQDACILLLGRMDILSAVDPEMIA